MLWIDQIINDVITGLEELHSTYNIYELYNALEISIRYLDRDNVLLQGNHAIYHRSYFDEEIIFIRNDLSSKYEEFILAHELGHALLHTNLKTTTFNPLMNLKKLERQANYFATKLLNVEFDSIALEGFTIDQIASTLEIPLEQVLMVSEMESAYSISCEGRHEEF